MMIAQERYEPVESYLESFRHLVCVSVFLNFSSRSSLPIPIPTSAESRLDLIRLAAPSIRRRWRTEEDAMPWLECGRRRKEAASWCWRGQGRKCACRTSKFRQVFTSHSERRRATQIGGRCCAALRCVAIGRSVGAFAGQRQRDGRQKKTGNGICSLVTKKVR